MTGFTVKSRTALALVLVVGLGACNGGGERSGGLFGPREDRAQTSQALSPPQPDSRGVITYASYQVMVAQEGDTVASMAGRVGLIGVLRRQRWGLAIAGASVRYRRRVRMFDRIEMRSRLVTWDARFMYLEQSMWRRDGECASHILYRAAVTGKDGIVPPDRVLEALGRSGHAAPPAPEWVEAWARADAARPWPPMQDGVQE